MQSGTAQHMFSWATANIKIAYVTATAYIWLRFAGIERNCECRFELRFRF